MIKSFVISDIMTRDVITVREDTPVHEVVRLVLDQRISGIPVVDTHGQLCGVVTLTDLYSMLSKLFIKWKKRDTRDPIRRKTTDIVVGKIMTRDVISVKPLERIDNVVSLSHTKNIHIFPVVNNKGALIGVVGQRDILKAGFEMALS